MRILLATGGAPHSEIAVRLTVQLARATPAEITVLTVAAAAQRRAHAEAIAAQTAAQFADLAATVQTHVRVGRTAGIIAEEAEGGYDLLVMGERADYHLLRRVAPTTVDQLIERSPCPLLVARRADLLEQTLVCESGRRPLVAARLAAELAPLLSSWRSVTLLHVMSQMAAGPGVSGWALGADVADHIKRGTPEGELLQEGLAALTAAGVDAKPLLRHGRVIDEIVAEAQTGGHDLLVIGAHRVTGWERLMLADQAYAILTRTHQSLLIL